MIQIVIPDCFGFSKPLNDEEEKREREKNRPAYPPHPYPTLTRLPLPSRERGMLNSFQHLFFILLQRENDRFFAMYVLQNVFTKITVYENFSKKNKRLSFRNITSSKNNQKASEIALFSLLFPQTVKNCFFAFV